MKTKFWVTRDRRRLDPVCMDCQHLRNCVKRIMRLGNWRKEWLSILLDEINRRCLPKVGKTTKKELETV